MIMDILYHFVTEFIHALLIDELSERVRRNVAGRLDKRRIHRRQRFYRHLSRRNAQRLLHKLRTEADSPVQ